MAHRDESEHVPSIPLLEGFAGAAAVGVDLECDDDHLFLIIEWPATTTYHNQVGGYSCRQASQRGLILPLHNDSRGHASAFLAAASELFLGSKYGGWCAGGIDRSDVFVLDRALMLVAPTCLRQLCVDTSRLSDCCEAWVRVVGLAYTAPVTPGDDPAYPTRPLLCVRGVLTWQNSD